jgi:hypothetical protein
MKAWGWRSGRLGFEREPGLAEESGDERGLALDAGGEPGPHRLEAGPDGAAHSGRRDHCRASRGDRTVDHRSKAQAWPLAAAAAALARAGRREEAKATAAQAEAAARLAIDRGPQAMALADACRVLDWADRAMLAALARLPRDHCGGTGW